METINQKSAHGFVKFYIGELSRNQCNICWRRFDVIMNLQFSDICWIEPLYDATGLLTDTWHCGLRMRCECRERFPRHRGLAILTCITARAWRFPLNSSGFLWIRWRAKRSRQSRRMRNPQFYVSGKRPIAYTAMLGIAIYYKDLQNLPTAIHIPNAD